VGGGPRVGEGAESSMGSDAERLGWQDAIHTVGPTTVGKAGTDGA
jgi:hypothetical protein